MDTIAIVIIGVILCGGLGWAVGDGKGRGGLGFALGLFLGPLGVIAAAIVEPSLAALSERERQLAAVRLAVVRAQEEAASPVDPAARVAEIDGAIADLETRLLTGAIGVDEGQYRIRKLRAERDQLEARRALAAAQASAPPE